MDIDEAARTFALTRRRRIKAWPWMAAAIATVLTGLIAWLAFRHPLLINPALVRERILDGSLDTATTALLASALPFVVIVCIGITLVAFLFACAAYAMERKYLTLLRALVERSPPRS